MRFEDQLAATENQLNAVLGFNNSGDFGVLQYRVKKGGKVMTGQWAQTKQSTPGAGIETLTKN